MKIYKLTVNEVASDPTYGMISSHRAERTERMAEYYSSKEKAEERRREIYEGFRSLVGFVPKAEAIVSEIDVIE